MNEKNYIITYREESNMIIAKSNISDVEYGCEPDKYLMVLGLGKWYAKRIVTKAIMNCIEMGHHKKFNRNDHQLKTKSSVLKHGKDFIENAPTSIKEKAKSDTSVIKKILKNCKLDMEEHKFLDNLNDSETTD